MNTPPPALLLVISGPAGAGKTTLCNRLLEEFPDLQRVVTTTTREPRDDEVEGIDYHFLGVLEFEAKAAAGGFYEWARVHARYYGSERRAVLEPLKAGRDLLLNIDVQGAANYRKAAAEDTFLAERLVTIFIKPQSLDQMHKRLIKRAAETPEDIERRMKSAEKEIAEADKFDEVIVTGSRDADYNAFREIYLRYKDERMHSYT
jgi:guanylate kinase